MWRGSCSYSHSAWLKPCLFCQAVNIQQTETRCSRPHIHFNNILMFLDTKLVLLLCLSLLLFARLRCAELLCLTCRQNNLPKALWSCGIWKICSTKSIRQIHASTKKKKKTRQTHKNKGQTHLCSALHIQTLCCINFLEWPQVIKAAWCNCTNFIVRIVFICMCLLGINLRITRRTRPHTMQFVTWSAQ